MSDATAITTLEAVYEQLSVEGSTDDTLIQNLIDRYTDMFEKYCGVDSFLVADYTEYTDGNGSVHMFVKNNPVNSITQIAVDSDWVWGADTTATASDYRIVGDRYIAYKTGFASGLQNVKIQYNAGWSVIPEDLEQALLMEVVRMYIRRKDPDVEIKTLTDGSTHLTPSGLMPSTKQILSKYMRLRAV